MGGAWSGARSRQLRRNVDGDVLLQNCSTGPAANGLVQAHDAEAAAPDGRSPEEEACLLPRLLFFWAFPVLWAGYQQGHTDLHDLPPLPMADRPEAVEAKVCGAWRERLQRQPGGERGAPPQLLPVLARLTGRLFLQALSCHGLMLCASYLQPVMLHRLLVQLGMPRNDEDVFWLTADAVGIALAVMLMWIFAEYAWIMYVRCDLRVQVALNHLTYRKSLYLSNGDSRYTIGDLQNHFSTDATKPMQNFMHNQHAQVLDAIVTIIVVMSHLIGLIGSAGVVALLTLVVFSPGQLLLTRRMKVMTRRIQKCRDTRGRLSSEFFSAMRVVKCFCLEGAALAQVGASRDEELKAQWEKRKIFPFNNFIASSASLFATTAAFTWLLLVLKQPPDPAVAFTVLSWNNLLKSSVMQLPNAINQLIDTHVSLQRIQKLLHTDTATDQWLDPLPLRSLQASGHAAESSSSRPEHGEASGADDFRLSACDLGWKVAGGHRGIQSLSLSVKQGELMLVCGSIGSGKSLLLEGLAGTRLPLAGECSRGGRRTAYVAQRPWLLNGTLAENVTFGQPFDPDRMARIVECCALGPDLQALPDGLETLVGEDGVQLSGGQKQRVSLARAIYSGAEVLLLDDVLSALDAHVGRHVWEQAICGELRGRTRVLATHQVQYCSCEEVDRILVLGKEGALEHFGTFAQLSGAGFNFGTVGSASKDAEEEGTTDDPSQSESGKADAKQLASVASPPPSGRPGRGGELSAETRRLGSVQLRDFLAYARACGGLRGFVTIAVLMVTYYGSLLASNLELAAWANTNQGNASGDPAEAQEESERHLTRYLLLSLLVGLSCLSFFFGIQLVALRGSRNLHRLLINSLLKTELRFFDLTPTGRVLNRCLKDMAQIDDNMPAACRMLFESLMSFVISLVILTLFAWEALFAIPPFALAYCRVMTIYRWPARDLKRLEGVSRSPAMSHFSDSIRGTSTIRAYQHDLRFMGQNLELCSRIQKTVYWFWVAQGWVSMVQEVTGTLLLAIIAGIIGYRASTGALSAGLAGLALSYAVSMPRDLMWLSRRLANLEVEFVSVERVLEYARLRPEDRAEASGAGGAAGLGEAPCAICAENVWFRYAPESPWVLSGLSLSIARGARTAFVGRTGCGKSSFLSVIARLYPVSDSGGRLLVHGLDVMAVPLPALRKTVRVLLQDPIFFQGTVRSNLLCRPPQLVGAASGAPLADLEREDVALRRALTLAGLGARLESLPDGLDSRVEESGHNFSHGERQLLCLARALADPPSEAQGPEAAVLGPRVLLCDEPTASCDLATDEHIHGTLLRALPADWTLIVVCHRLHRIREFDDVFVLEKGAVAEHGAPASLLGKPPKAGSERGLLAAMCRQQGVA